MNKWPKDNEAALDAYYSRPDGSARWEVTNLVYIFPPWKIFAAGTKTELKRGLRVHKLVAPSLVAIFNELWEIHGKSQEEIAKSDLDQIGGAYYFRPRRGSNRLSNHARGIAIDIDPLDNAMRKGNRGDIPTKVIDVFIRHGWRWGGVYGDPMHFEAVDNGGFKPFSNYQAPAPYTESEEEILSWVDACTDLVKVSEDFRAKKYWDVKQWAIGYGENANALPADTVWTKEYAEYRLKLKLTEKAREVAKLVGVKMTKYEGGALTCFTYNLGSANLSGSTLLKKLNSGDKDGAADQFQHWVKATIDGVRKTLPGLVKRRAAERALFLTKGT
jgi:GH24 family phage-related lysozyme (muramidase)